MKKVNKKTLTKLSQSEVVTLAVYLLGGDQHAIDTEDAAVKAHELAPGRFSWRKYPEQINLELIRVYLSDAKKPDKGSLLSGSGRTGWSLTRNGLRWVRNVKPRLENTDFGRSRAASRSGSIDENRWRRERARILSTSAWARWVQGERDLSAKEIREVFRIDSYAVGQMREAKVTRLTSLFVEDQEVGPFLDHVSRLLQE